MNTIYLIIGPPAVGKSTTSRALAGRFPRSIHIPVDDLRNMVVNGLALPAAEWGDELSRQVALARNAVIAMALAYRQAGFTVVIDDFWDPNRLTEYRALAGVANVRRVLLLPAQAEAHRRNLLRSGDSPARLYIDEGIRIVYDELTNAIGELRRQGWLVVDTSALTVDEAVETILAADGRMEAEV
ncbi:MAG: AAA family ATPase [Candidatus Promineofilum sp.]|nr:AAA family ATPase [Promineifilum sp.]